MLPQIRKDMTWFIIMPTISFSFKGESIPRPHLWCFFMPMCLAIPPGSVKPPLVSLSHHPALGTSGWVTPIWVLGRNLLSHHPSCSLVSQVPPLVQLYFQHPNQQEQHPNVTSQSLDAKPQPCDKQPAHQGRAAATCRAAGAPRLHNSLLQSHAPVLMAANQAHFQQSLHVFCQKLLKTSKSLWCMLVMTNMLFPKTYTVSQRISSFQNLGQSQAMPDKLRQA